VRASSVNPVDTGMRAGIMRTFVRLRLPAARGVDVAGEVAELGEGVTHFALGDPVFAYTGLSHPDGYGEYAVLQETAVARVLSTLDWPQAGTVAGVGATAYEAFTVHAPLTPYVRVFINGGAGGVGTYAIQVAKALGASATVTTSSAKADIVRALVADDVIDCTTTDPYAPALAKPVRYLRHRP
jgi:NADPH:quinone reductase-like Zn-dependent oxidoreductase